MTPSLSSPLGPLLEESCPLRFFVPNKAAMEPDIAAIYTRMGLTANAVRTVAMGTPQRDIYYYCQELGQRLFHLPLGPLALACLARNTAEDHALMDRMMTTEGPEGFARAWLEAHGFPQETHDDVQRTDESVRDTPAGVVLG